MLVRIHVVDFSTTPSIADVLAHICRVYWLFRRTSFEAVDAQLPGCCTKDGERLVLVTQIVSLSVDSAAILYNHEIRTVSLPAYH